MAIIISTARELDLITELACICATNALKIEDWLRDVDSQSEDSSSNQSALQPILDEPPP